MAIYWVAKDKGGAIYAYTTEPKRGHVTFYATGTSGINSYIPITGDYRTLFNGLTWENSPLSIDTDD